MYYWSRTIRISITQICIEQCIIGNTLLNTDLIGAYPDGSAPIIHCSIQIWLVLILMVLLQLCIAQYKFEWCLSWWFCSNNTLLNTDLIGGIIVAEPPGEVPIKSVLSNVLLEQNHQDKHQSNLYWAMYYWSRTIRISTNKICIEQCIIGAEPSG
jgi:hypothetical protein